MGFFTDSGLITRGMGLFNKMLTRGLGKRSKLGGGFIPVWKHNEHCFNISSSIAKSSTEIFNIHCMVKFISIKNLHLSASIYKENTKSFNISSPINSSKLIEILDQI